MKTVFEEIGEYMDKETDIKEILKDPENISIIIRMLEERGWTIY